jgi:hypothetical protein
VSPILGIWASQNYTRYQLPTSFESIATTTVGSSGVSNVEFTSIPSTYTHLQIRGIFRQTGGDQWNSIQFNGDTGSNYATHNLYGTGASAVSEAAAPGTNTLLGNGAQPIPFVIDILDYANTNKFKTTRLLWGMDSNGGGYIMFGSHLWRNTNAITSVKINGVSSNFAQYSSFALYGIKGA